ncbi:MAG: ABC transporter substrate-binding protein [Chloroflexi bacterium]|nr:ABC transporter substrate-binding protein [Chloroflexota bacterium]
MKTPVGFVLTGMIAVLAAGCAAPPAAPSPTSIPRVVSTVAPSAPAKSQRIKLQNPSFGSTFANFYLGKEVGIFKEEGIDLEPMVIKSVLTMPVIMAGEVDFTTVFSFALYGGMRGQPVKALMSFKSGGSWYLYGAKGIQTPQDLKGKTVAVTSVGSLGHTATKEALRYLGIDPEKEVTFIGVGGEAERWVALRSGSVAGAALSPPYNLMAKDEGFKEFVFTGDVVELASNGLATSVKMIKEKPDLVKRMIRATIKSNMYMKERPQESIRFLMKEFDMDEMTAKATHEVGVKTTIISGLPTDKALQNLVQMGKETGQLTGKEKLDDALDFTLLKEVLKEMKLQ